VYQISSKSGGNCRFYSIQLNFQHGGGGHLESGRSLLVLHFFTSFEYDKPSRQIIEIRRKLTELLQFEFFTLAASAIFDLMIGDL
jgi:hypothetical protein